MNLNHYFKNGYLPICDESESPRLYYRGLSCVPYFIELKNLNDVINEKPGLWVGLDEHNFAMRTKYGGLILKRRNSSEESLFSSEEFKVIKKVVECILMQH